MPLSRPHTAPSPRTAITLVWWRDGVRATGVAFYPLILPKEQQESSLQVPLQRRSDSCGTHTTHSIPHIAPHTALCIRLATARAATTATPSLFRCRSRREVRSSRTHTARSNKHASLWTKWGAHSRYSCYCWRVLSILAFLLLPPADARCARRLPFHHPLMHFHRPRR